MWHESQALPMKWFLMSEKVSLHCVRAATPVFIVSSTYKRNDMYVNYKDLYCNVT